MRKGSVRIQVAAPQITRADILRVEKCMKSGWVSGISPFVDEFERKFARYCGCKYGVATNSGTTALHLALAALKVRPGDEVIIPTFTMIATANAVKYTGARPVLVDSEIDTWNINPGEIEAKITRRTKAILPIHTYGHPADMGQINEIATKHGLQVIEDAAEAHGAEYKSRKTGSLGDVGCFSFYSNKIITTGEGGMLVTNIEELAERAKWLRAHAFGRGGKHFYHTEIGFGYRMSGLQAALGLSQLERIEANVRRRRRNAKAYNELLSPLGERIRLPPEADWAKNVYWMYSILIQKESRVTRDRLIQMLARRGIESRTFFYPIHVQPAYQHELRGGSYPVSESLAHTGINLPSGNNLTEDKVTLVSEAVVKSLL